MNRRMISANTIKLFARTLIAGRFISSFFLRIYVWDWTLADFHRQGLSDEKTLLVLIAAQLWQLVASVMLLFGLKTRVACMMLIIFCISSSLSFHQFWTADHDHFANLFIDFIKDTAIIGGLLMLIAAGPGRFSFDERQQKMTDSPANG